MDKAELYYKQSFTWLFSYAYRMTNSESAAEDIVQDVFCTAIRKEIFDNRDNPSAWLLRAAKFEITHFYRRKVMEELPESYDIPYEEMEYFTAEETAILQSILSDTDYKIAKMHFIDGETEIKMASKLNMSVNALRVRIHRIKKKIKQHYLLLTLLAWTIIKK